MYNSQFHLSIFFEKCTRGTRIFTRLIFHLYNMRTKSTQSILLSSINSVEGSKQCLTILFFEEISNFMKSSLFLAFHPNLVVILPQIKDYYCEVSTRNNSSHRILTPYPHQLWLPFTMKDLFIPYIRTLTEEQKHIGTYRISIHTLPMHMDRVYIDHVGPFAIAIITVHSDTFARACVAV